jgi:ABC-type transporter Mla maintaining outer membrane lipid asymmetry permease subunit MlaE
MKRFGAEIFVADLIGLSMLRELGPLMTAILLAGARAPRSRRRSARCASTRKSTR